MFKIFFVLLAPYVCFHIFSKVKVTEWPPIGKIAAHSAYDCFMVWVPDCWFGFFPPRFLEWESFSDCAFS